MLTAKVRNYVQAAEHLISLVRLGCEVWLDDFLQPVGEEFIQFRNAGADRSAAGLVPQVHPVLPCFLVGLARTYLRYRVPSGLAHQMYPRQPSLDRYKEPSLFPRLLNCWGGPGLLGFPGNVLIDIFRKDAPVTTVLDPMPLSLS